MFESVILIGPATDLFPLTNSHLKVMDLPVCNTELLLHNLNFLSPISEKIYIILLQKDVSQILPLISKVSVPIEIVGTECYDGTVQQLIKLKDRIQTNNVVVTKGDLITNIDARTMANEFIRKNYKFMTVLENSNSEAVVGYSGSNLLMYSKDKNYDLPLHMFTDFDTTLSTGMDVLQLYMFRKCVINIFDCDSFSFRSSLLPKLINQYRDTFTINLYNPMNCYIYQLNSAQKYVEICRHLKTRMYVDCEDIYCTEDKTKMIKQYIKKNKITDKKNCIGDNLQHQNACIVNSIIGNDCILLDNCKILSSILMNKITIGASCHIEDSVIGSNVIIPDNSVLMKCTVSPFYKFTKSIEASETTFSCN